MEALVEEVEGEAAAETGARKMAWGVQRPDLQAWQSQARREQPTAQRSHPFLRIGRTSILPLMERRRRDKAGVTAAILIPLLPEQVGQARRHLACLEEILLPKS